MNCVVFVFILLGPVMSSHAVAPKGSCYWESGVNQFPRDCQEVHHQCSVYSTGSGVFLIQPDGAPQPFHVYCNDSIDGGGWTVIQRRVDGADDFYRTWQEYKQGFGLLHEEFWLGNENIKYLTNQRKYELRIDMNNVNGVPYFAKYDLFRISDEWSKYRMVELGRYLPGSTANRDSLAFHRNMSFSTYDGDNDFLGGNCAVSNHGAWWYKDCDYSDLNSNYFGSGQASVEWTGLPESDHNLKYTEMKVRPL